jgi:signal transduction histidine kinase
MTEEKDSPEREKTDAGLRSERQETDRALTESQQAAEEDADMVVQRARAAADAVLGVARSEADRQLEENAPLASRSAITRERAREDQALAEERFVADESLRREREETARALALLLPLEREKTDRYLLTERVRSDEMVTNRDDFLGIVSHDLRDLIGGVVMSAALLATRAGDDDFGKYALAQADRIQRYAARMNRLIGDLVDVASIDAGKLAMTPAVADIALVAAEAVDTFRSAAATKGIALELELVAAPLLLECDHARMLQVLANLIANSMKFTPRHGTIVVHAERSEGDLRLFVRDTGTGIPPHLREAVFERFWQVGPNDRRGLGLGLYLSRSIVQAHGGRIWADSSGGGGTTIHITLPAAREERAT